MNRFIRKLAGVLAAAGVYLMTAGTNESLSARLVEKPWEERMKNVMLS